MKYIFLVTFAALVLASVATALMMDRSDSDVPVLYWVTDANPARVEQIAIFREWLKKNGYPDIDLRLDTANRNAHKIIIQGVSGIGSDIIDVFSGNLAFFQQIGLLEDITEMGKELGFSPSATYSAVYHDIVIDGAQYSFPCNVTGSHLWVNLDTFAKLDLPAPPETWDVEEFERMGKAFVAKANPPGERQTIFFANAVPMASLRRSTGLSMFNETLTQCTLDDPRNAEMLDLIYKWTYEDRILPTQADVAASATETGYGGASIQLFNRGNYAMFASGRHALIQLREFDNLNLGVSQLPYVRFPNTVAMARAAAIYAGSPHKELAKYFLAFLASEDYNMHVIQDADALPPSPEFAKTDAYLQPPDFPNEWGLHESFSEVVASEGIPASYSPFVLPATSTRIENEVTSGFMTHLYDSKTASKMMTDRINGEITQTLRENPALQPEFDRLVELQKQIDSRLKRGEKIPAEWVKNPFYLHYYRSLGKLDEEGSSAPSSAPSADRANES